MLTAALSAVLPLDITINKVTITLQTEKFSRQFCCNEFQEMVIVATKQPITATGRNTTTHSMAAAT